MARSARIGVFGGSFNPVHSGHLRLAEYALSELNLDKVYLVPANCASHKDTDFLLPAKLRLACLKRAVRGRRGLDVSACDIRRGGATYTIDTLRDFRRRFGRGPVFYFLAGADNAKTVSRWKSADKMLKLCRFTVFSRPGAPRARTPRGVLWLDFPALDVSSSDVRRRLIKGVPLKGLVPAGTEALLKDFKRKAEFRSLRER